MKIFSRILVVGFLVFGVLSVDAQKLSSESRKNWEIVVTSYSNLREGYSYSVNSRGTLVKLETQDSWETHSKTSRNLSAGEMLEMGELIGKLNLAQTTAENTVGTGENNPPYGSLSIEIGGKEYMMEGKFVSHIKVRILTDRQKAVYEALKVKLNGIGIETPIINDTNPANYLTSQTDFSVPLVPAEQKMLFRFEYWKSGDGFQHKGWYMDESGKVYKFSYEKVLYPENPNRIDFRLKMRPTLVAQAKPEELIKLRELVKKIERGKYSEEQVSWDKGTAKIDAFLPDAGTGKYRLLELASIGDAEGINDAPETEELILMLKRIVPAD